MRSTLILFEYGICFFVIGSFYYFCFLSDHFDQKCDSKGRCLQFKTLFLFFMSVLYKSMFSGMLNLGPLFYILKIFSEFSFVLILFSF